MQAGLRLRAVRATLTSMKIVSWNVNGIRAIQRKGGFAFLAVERPDILCLQETRAEPEQAGDVLPAYPYRCWNPAKKPGYSGTAVFSAVRPVSMSTGMGVKVHDGEGRITAVELDRFFLVNVYTPNSREDLSRLPYRARWDKAFLKFILGLEETKPVVFCGDINVAHQEIDLSRPRENRGAHGFTDVERAGFTSMLDSGYVDSFRHLHKEGGMYTWWRTAGQARERNVGWRIDYVVISKALLPALRAAFILRDVQGSDHCPVGVVLDV
jgi:exodeoxyribonuclease-3